METKPTLPPQEDAHALTVVGLGGSAGSIPALQAFFRATPLETGSAYVVVVHLSPEHDSDLAELLSRSTPLPVLQVIQTVKVERGHVYVIPPGKQLEMVDGTLHLTPLETGRGNRAVIDTFFNTLAAAYGSQAAVVVLSGAGADGALGLRRVRELGGLGVVQFPREAEYDSMPRHAIATGQVDLVLPAAIMGKQIEEYWEASRRMRLPEEAAPSLEQRSCAQELEASQEALRSVNEELSAVNHELRSRVEEVSRTNHDLQVFLAATDIGTLFLDRALRIKRYTPAAEQLFNCISTAVGRPLSNLASRLEYPELEEDAGRVLARLAPVEREIATTDGQQHFLARLLPYRSAEDRIEGVVVNFIDISTRRLTEQALHTSEERLRRIIESAQDHAIFTLDLERRVSSWNSGAEAMFGYAEPEILGKTGDVLFTPEDRARGGPAGEAAAALEQGRAENERWHLRQDGSRFYGSGSTTPLLDTSGSPVGLVKVMRDLTEQKRAEEALRESEARFRTLSDAVPQVIWTNTPAGQADYFNQRWYDYTGLSYEESAGPGWQTIVHPEDAPASVERWRESLASGEVFEAEYRLRRRDGVYCWHLGRNVPLRNAAGEVGGWFGSATDIEDLKQAQAAEREAQERFRLLVEGTRDCAMFLLDREGRITFWSVGAERVFGYPEAEAVGKPGAFIFTPEDREQGAPETELETARTTGRAIDRRWHLRKDASRFWADGLLMRLDDPAGRLRGYAKVARDATEQKRAEEALHQALEAVAAANEQLEARVEERTHALVERTEELARMSDLQQELLRRLVTAQEQERARISRDLHDDTGQQIAGLLLGLDRLLKSPGVTGDPAAQETGRHLQALAANIAQKSHRLAVTLRPTALDDLGLTAALTNYMQEWSQWSGIAAEVETVGLETRLPAEVETTIYRVAQEALTNVLRHGGARGGAAGVTRVSLLLQRRPGEVLTVIEDNGLGFDVETALGAAPGERRLGIFGMQERARLAGGTLTIESEPGRGTTLYLRLPLSPEEERTEGGPDA